MPLRFDLPSAADRAMSRNHDGGIPVEKAVQGVYPAFKVRPAQVRVDAVEEQVRGEEDVGLGKVCDAEAVGVSVQLQKVDDGIVAQAEPALKRASGIPEADVGQVAAQVGMVAAGFIQVDAAMVFHPVGRRCRGDDVAVEGLGTEPMIGMVVCQDNGSKRRLRDRADRFQIPPAPGRRWRAVYDDEPLVGLDESRIGSAEAVGNPSVDAGSDGYERWGRQR